MLFAPLPVLTRRSAAAVGNAIQHAATTAAVVGTLLLASVGHAQLQPAGPAPIEPGLSGVGVDGMTNPQAAGAIHAIAPHPWDAQILFAGSVTGGLFRTFDARSAEPTWTPVATDAASGAIGALTFDVADPTGRTVVAGIGSYSSFIRLNSAQTGLLYSSDLGNSWTALDGGGVLTGQDISGVHVFGHNIVVTANERSAQPGVYFSSDCGATFTRVSVGDGSTTGLPSGIAYDLVSPKWQPYIVYAAIVDAEASGGTSGLYRSNDFGATWHYLPRPALEALLFFEDYDGDDTDEEIKTTNVELATGANGSVFIGIVNAVQTEFGDAGSILSGLFAANLWNPSFLQQLDVPPVHPGGQGDLHFSIAADPYDVNILYVGGDRQDGPFPNAIGATSSTGNLWRGNVTQPPGSQFVHLTHSNTLGPAGGGTASGSAPHADSRDIVFDAWGNLIQVDDGGVYAHTSPRDAFGDWYSLNGNLQATELKDASFDRVSQIAIGGSQDVSSHYQPTPGATVWNGILGGDGGDTAVDVNAAPAGFSVRYFSAQFLGNFVFTVWDAAGGFRNATFPALSVVDGGPPLRPQFYTPIEVNAVQGGRIVFGGIGAVYESFDLGESLLTVAIGTTITQFGIGPIGYGAADNPDALWYGTGSQVFVRDGAYPDLPADSLTFPGRGVDLVTSIELDPANGATGFALTLGSGVFRSTDYGASWTDLTGNLASLQTGNLYQAEYLEGAAGDALVVGGFNGQLFIAHEASGFSTWSAIDAGLPEHTIVWDLDYDATSDTLIVGTVGQGAWRLDNVLGGP